MESKSQKYSSSTSLISFMDFPLLPIKAILLLQLQSGRVLRVELCEPPPVGLYQVILFKQQWTGDVGLVVPHISISLNLYSHTLYASEGTAVNTSTTTLR